VRMPGMPGKLASGVLTPMATTAASRTIQSL
jgi:hypothetical protein